MFVYQSKKSFRRRLCAVLLAVSMAVAGGMLPLPVQAVGWDDLPPSATVYAAEEDMTLPVALTGTSARSALLMEASTGEVIFRQNEGARLPMASTTKVMTALVVLETCELTDTVVIPTGAVGVEGSSIYLTEGEKLTVEDLLYALMLESANDAAVALAIHAAGDVASFAALMNRKAEALGLTDTHFTNPHGLDEDGHYTTALELALIMRAAMENADFRAITAATRRTVPRSEGEGVRLLLNHNKLLRQYDGVIGGKTGFTKVSGRCLVSAAMRDGVTLIAVTLSDPNDWADHAAMLDYGFSLYTSVTLCEPDFYRAPLSVQAGTQPCTVVRNTEGLTLPLRRDHGAVTCTVELPRFVFAPVDNGQVMGRLVFTEHRLDGSAVCLGSVPILADYAVDKATYSLSLRERIKGWFGG